METPIIGKITCPLKIKFFGLRRFGNHAIINWLIPMLGEWVCHINDVHPYSNNLCRFYRDGKFTKVDEIPQIDTSIISYENVDLSQPWTEMDVQSHQTIYVLLLRDPYNTLASMMNNDKVVDNVDFRVPIYNLKKLWKMYAKEYLGYTNYLPNDTIKINFNKWFVNKKYRKSLASSAGLKFSDSGLNTISGYGGGSSFDLMNYDGKAQKMNVLSRWKKYKDHPKYKERLNDQDLFRLSKKIFGQIIS